MHLTIRVFGYVQGVFFRASTKEKALELGIKGFVRNEPDNSVYIEAEGDQTPLNTFLTWCQRGPRLATVDRCEMQEGETKGFSDFLIK
jgi:acylphosphatase